MGVCIHDGEKALKKIINKKYQTEMIMTATEMKRNVKRFCLLGGLLDVGEDNRGMSQVGASEGPSLLCAGVHGQGRGL